MQTYGIISDPISRYSRPLRHVHPMAQPMAPTARLAGSKSSQHLPTHDAFPHRTLAPSASSVCLAFPQSASVHSLLAQGSRVRSSRTWTASSAGLGLVSDTDEVEDRAVFVHEYNRLAKKHGVRLLVVDDFTAEQKGEAARSPEKRGWLHRILRSNPTSSRGASQAPNNQHHASQLQARHRRSVSDLAHIFHSRHEPPKAVDIQDMIRLSGKSMLYLPQEYAPCSLILPTCIRATAQHLAQNVTTRGLFRIPGSVRIVTALFDHYCYMDKGGEDIASTVRCVNLPLHIPYSVHDVASTFKRLLSVLPGGILGSLALFDALVAIHSQLNGEPEFPRTKQTKIRARLIALAVGTIKSQFRRELICAVFGLLSLIGRVSEVTPREDEEGRSLPTADLMGYGALGIIFGPLLVGDLLDQYTMKLATPTTGMLLFPLSPQRLRRDRRKAKAEGSQPGAPAVDKVLVANNIAEMLIANWRDVVRQMRSLGTHFRKDASSVDLRNSSLRASAWEPFTIKMPHDMNATRKKSKSDGAGRDGSPEPDTPTMGLRRRRSKPLKKAASHKLLSKMSISTLTPTREESTTEGEVTKDKRVSRKNEEQPTTAGSRGQPSKPSVTMAIPDEDSSDHPPTSHSAAPPSVDDEEDPSPPGEGTAQDPPQVYLDSVPPRLSSKTRHEHDSSEMTQPAMPFSVGELTELSPIATEDRLSKASGTRRRTRASNHVSSYDGSEDSPGPLMTSRREHGFFRTGELSPRESRNPLTAKALSPRRRSNTNLARSGAKFGPGPPETQAAGNGPQQDNDKADMDVSRERSGRKKAVGSQRTLLNSVDDWHGGRRDDTPGITRDSMDRTPEHFYPPSGVRQMRQSGWSGALGSQQSGGDGDGFPDGLDLMRFLDQEQGESSASGDHRPKQAQHSASCADKLLTRQPRASKSHGQLRSQVRVTVQSPSRSSSSEALSKRGSVKAMAAMFESQDPAHSKPPSPTKRKSTDGGAWIQAPSGSPCKCGRRAQPGPVWLRYSWDKSPESLSGEELPSNCLEEKRDERGGCAHDGEPTANVAAAAQSDEPRVVGASARLGARKSMPALRWSDAGTSTGGRLKPVPSLGTMVPCREQPPIAQHLNRPRPPSTPSPAQHRRDELPIMLATAPPSTWRPRGTTVLYAQIQSLQRHLSARTEEASQLRRQLEAQENSELGTLSEQLRAAKRDVSMWKERAESAEKRVQVFERLTSRLRGFRDAIFKECMEDEGDDDVPCAPRRKSISAEDGGNAQAGDGQESCRPSAVGRSSDGGGRSSDSGRTEDAGVVSARIRRCLHGHLPTAVAQEGTLGSLPEVPTGVAGGDGTLSPRELEAPDTGSGPSAEQLFWAVAEELLRMEDDGTI